MIAKQSDSLKSGIVPRLLHYLTDIISSFNLSFWIVDSFKIHKKNTRLVNKEMVFSEYTYKPLFKASTVIPLFLPQIDTNKYGILWFFCSERMRNVMNSDEVKSNIYLWKTKMSLQNEIIFASNSHCKFPLIRYNRSL